MRAPALARRIAALLLGALLAPAPARAQEARAPAAPPDVVVIVADDLGWGDVFPHVPTPNLERLARAGTTFRAAFAMPVCTPSRYAMLFGRYGRREGVLGGVRKIAAGAERVPSLQLFALPQLFLAAGYSTAAFGKWHLDLPTVPAAELARPRGFQTFRAGTRGNLGRSEHGYTNWTRIDDGVESDCTQYATLAVRDAFLEWWRATAGPRFAWVAFHAPHQPFHAPPPELLDGPPPRPQARPMFAAAVRALDHVLGDLLAELDLAHTLVVFVSDNGTPPLAPAPGQDPQRLKGSVFDGGVRVPLIVAGPGVRAGAECDALVHVVDLMATFAERLGRTLPTGAGEDSCSFAPLLADARGGGRRAVFFEILTETGSEDGVHDEIGVRSRTHALRIVGDGGGPAERTREELYDLTKDPEELHPLPLDDEANRAFRDQLRHELDGLPPRPGG